MAKVIDLDKFCFQLKAENLSSSKQKLFLSNIRNIKVEKNLEDNPGFHVLVLIVLGLTSETKIGD